MGLISSLVCEYILPIPLDDFSEDEREDFKDIKWDELIFYTSSFFDGDLGPYGVSNYTISEDGQFYKNEVELEFIKNKKGEIETKERDGGIERLDFTGEIYFGTEILGKDYDYTVAFVALLYKGDLKELKLDEWKKKDNGKRKKKTEELYEAFQKENKKVNKWWYKSIYPIRWAAFKGLGLFSWSLILLLRAVTYIRNWISR